MEPTLYYQPPEQELFDELKNKAIEVWKTMDNTYGHVDEKVGAIERIQNVGDNFMYIVAMFGINNQQKLSDKLSDETKKAVRDRMIDGGNPEYLIVF